MGIFDKIFKSERDIAKEEIVEVPWHPLTRLEQLEEIEEESTHHLTGIFKHSTSCGISRMVLKKFEREYPEIKDKDVKLYFLDLLSNREISNRIAEKFAVRHESPQLILIKDKKVVHHSSHHSISTESISEKV